MSKVFEVGVPAISKHLKNIFEEKELDKSSVVSKMEITADDLLKFRRKQILNDYISKKCQSRIYSNCFRTR